MKINDVLYEFLEDDDTELGGKSFANERVIDFIQDTDLSVDDDIADLNETLKECGIKPIDVSKLSLLDRVNTLINHYNLWRIELQSDLDMYDDAFCEEEKGEIHALNRVIRDLERVIGKDIK